MRKGKIIIQPSGTSGDCYVIVKATNGKVLQTSEIFTTTRNAQINIAAMAAVFNVYNAGGIAVTDLTKKQKNDITVRRRNKR